MSAFKKHPYYCTFLAIILLLSIFGMQGCAGYQAIIAERGAQASDDAYNAALFALCKGIPVGAIKRALNTEEKRQAYNTLCADGEFGN